MKKTNFLQRKRRARARISVSVSRPRLSVYRSNRQIYAQIIDDTKRRTLVAACERDLTNLDSKKVTPRMQKKTESAENKNLTSLKTNRAYLVGELLAKRALAKKVKKIVFDKGGYKYHGRVAALAEGARKGGLEF